MIAYSGLKSRIDRLANTAKKHGDVAYLGFIEQNNGEFILDLRFTKRGVHDRSQLSKYKTRDTLIDSVTDIENISGNSLVLFECEELLE